MDERPKGIAEDWIQIEFRVPREYAGWRADRFVANRMPRLSRTRIQKILGKSGFDEQGRTLKPNRCLTEGERIILFRPPPEEPDVPRHFGVLYEDEWILAVDKPAGLPVHPTARYHKNTLTALLRERYGDNRPILAHRLDSETSGVLICAKNKEAEKKLKVMFAKRRIQKLYLAVVNGIPDPSASRIEVPLGPDTDGPVHVKMAGRPDGQPALTEYKVIRDLGDRALVECRPRTGRQHQIRAHFAHIGHHIVGDKMYCDDPGLFLEYIEQGMTEDIERRTGAKRHMLHASAISFVHPMTKKEILIESPIPDDMKAFIE